MASLSRPPTRQSTLSWWSDRNPPGATISIHFAAKPVMKLMYHQQAMSFLRKNRGAPLSSTTMDVYSSYLTYKYVAAGTRVVILGALREAIAKSSGDAQTVADALLIRSDIAVELLQSTHTEILKYICSLLGELASYKPTRVIVSASNLILMQTVSLLRAKDPSVIESALNALGLIAKWTDSAQAVLDAGTIDFSRELVDSSKGQIRKSVCETLGSLARHEPTLRSVLESNLCAQLVSLLHDEDIDVVDSALYALDGTTGFPDGAKAAINAGVLDAIDRLLESSNIHVRDAACSMLENLASYEFAAVGSRKRCALLVSLLRDPDNSVVKSAISALACITTWPDGARATVAAGVLAVFDDLLRDPNSRVQERTCETLGNLARRKFTVDAVLAARPCPSIVSLLRHDDIGVVRSAICALAWIAKSSDGARAAVDVGIMNLVVELGASPDRGVREWVCQALGNMASHEVMAVSILETKPCVTLVNLLTDSDVDIDIIRNAARALAFISRVPQGSQDAMDARAQDVFDALAGSPDREVREWACKFLRNMASHPVTAIVVLKAKPCARLVSLLRDEHTSVMRNAIYALFWIAWTPTGIQVVVDSGMLDFLDELASTGSMMSHESTVDQVVLELDLCARLVGLLRNSDTCVVDGRHASRHHRPLRQTLDQPCPNGDEV
ncbi:armadillo-type protein [Mycena galericulata]|nr:armadillo-type protein [Mycena galericulata]